MDGLLRVRISYPTAGIPATYLNREVNDISLICKGVVSTLSSPGVFAVVDRNNHYKSVDTEIPQYTRTGPIQYTVRIFLPRS